MSHQGQQDDDDRTPQEIADEHGQMLEFGLAVSKLRNAADQLERNGHMVVGAYEDAKSAIDDMDTVFAEYKQIEEHQREAEKEHRRGEHEDRVDDFCRICAQEDQ